MQTPERTISDVARNGTLQIDLCGEDVRCYVRAHAGTLAEAIVSHGSVVLRGAESFTAAAFRVALSHVIREFLDSEGEHTPISGQDRVFNPVGYAPDRVLLWHNENSFNKVWPDIIAFGCVRRADRGGESRLVDSAQLIRALDLSVVTEFRARGVRYVRRMGLGVGRDWRQIFNTTSKAAVEQYCIDQGVTFRWLEPEVLETSSIRAATTAHPISGRECWFNQIQHWHQRCLNSDDREAMLSMFGEAGMPRDCRFGDGGMIPDETVDHITKTYAANEWSILCDAGDVLILDNVSTAHGRGPFAGRRELLVATGMRKRMTLH